MSDLLQNPDFIISQIREVRRSFREQGVEERPTMEFVRDLIERRIKIVDASGQLINLLYNKAQ